MSTQRLPRRPAILRNVHEPNFRQPFTPQDHIPYPETGLAHALSCLDLLLEDLPPLLAPGDYKLLRFLEGLEDPLPLDEVAGLAGGDKIIHVAGSALGVWMNVIDGEDQPVLESVQPVEAHSNSI